MNVINTDIHGVSFPTDSQGSLVPCQQREVVNATQIESPVLTAQ